jgi:hypothetical protein
MKTDTNLLLSVPPEGIETQNTYYVNVITNLLQSVPPEGIETQNTYYVNVITNTEASFILIRTFRLNATKMNLYNNYACGLEKEHTQNKVTIIKYEK